METYRLMDFLSKTWTSLSNAGHNVQSHKLWHPTILQSDHYDDILKTKDASAAQYSKIIADLREEIKELKADHQKDTTTLLTRQHAEREKLMQESALYSQRLNKLIGISNEVINAYNLLKTKKGIFISNSKIGSKEKLYNMIWKLEGAINDIIK